MTKEEFAALYGLNQPGSNHQSWGRLYFEAFTSSKMQSQDAVRLLKETKLLTDEEWDEAFRLACHAMVEPPAVYRRKF
jgi:hypothetical protein